MVKSSKHEQSPEILPTPRRQTKTIQNVASEPVSHSDVVLNGPSATRACRFPAGCNYVAHSDAYLIAHIEQAHWNLSENGSGEADSPVVSDIEWGKSSERSSNSGDPNDIPDFHEPESINQAPVCMVDPENDRLNCSPTPDDVPNELISTYCAFCQTSIPGGPAVMETHIAVEHPEDSEPLPVPRRIFKSVTTVKAVAPVKRAPSSTSSRESESSKKRPGKIEQKKDKGKNSRDDDDDDEVYSPPAAQSIDVPVEPGKGRYARILRGRTGPDTSGEAARRASLQELTEKILKILTPRPDGNRMPVDDESSSDSDSVYSDDPLDQLRSIATVLSSYIYESNGNDSGYTKSGSGYATSYVERLQSLVDDSAEGNAVIQQVEEIVRYMDDSKVEYQKPEPTLLELIQRAASNGKTPPSLLMCTSAGFYGKDLGDLGWGCGYRNAQMLISTLLHWPVTREQLIKELGNDSVPNITRLQQLIHRAWGQGFDHEAASELGHEVTETSKWIGTTEIFALFSSMRIECAIKDFANGHGDLQGDLFRFVHGYFQESLTRGFAAPLFIQYSGHSRTVIGCDVTGLKTPTDPKLMQNVGLLIFDPGQSQWDIQIQGNPTRGWYKKQIYRPMTSFRQETFQVLYFTGQILSKAKYEQMKLPGAGHDTSAVWLD